MSLSPRSDAVTNSFYQWELRGRGWMGADYPVQLEPPYRPFFLLDSPSPATLPYDDGKRPTFLSSLVEGVSQMFSPAPPKVAPPPPYEEQAPFPAETDILRVTFELRVPKDFTASIDIGTQLLISLATTCYPVSYELIGKDGEICIQISCAEIDSIHVVESLRGYAPDVALVECADALRNIENPLLLQFGLVEEFFLPIAISSSLAVDPYISLFATLGATQEGEIFTLQILVEQLRNPWMSGITSALVDGRGECIVADAPEFIPLSKEKTRSPLYAVVMRIGIEAQNILRRDALLRAFYAFVLQFSRGGSNALVPLEFESNADRFRSALLERHSYRTGMVLSADELVGLLHLPDKSVTHEAFVRDTRTTKAAPKDARGHDCVLGENIHRGRVSPVSVSVEQRLKHVHVIGATGSGKSTLLLSMLLQDITAGRGVALIDPHGDLIDDLIARIPEERRDDVILIDPADNAWSFGFNVLDAHNDQERELVASDMVGIFKRLSSSWGDVMHTVLANALLAVMEQPATLITLRRFLVEESYRKTKILTITDPAIRYFWQHEFPSIGTRSIGPILTRLDSFLRSKLMRRMVGQDNARFNVHDAMENKQIILARLPLGQIGEENAYLLGSLLVSKFNLAALARQGQERIAREPYFLYIDEVQHFVTPSMETILSGTRKYGLGMTVAHQSLTQIGRVPDAAQAILDNAYTRIVFRVDEHDARTLAGGFSTFEAGDLQRLRTGEAIIRIGTPDHDCNICTALMSECDVNDEALAAVVEQSRDRYSAPAHVVDEALALHFSPLVGEMKEHPPTPPREEVITPPAAPKPVIFPINPPLIETTPGRGGQEHKYFQHLIKRLAEERGFRATIEDAAGDGRADVSLKKEGCSVACEISITTSVEHEVTNVTKCLKAGFDHVMFICGDKRRREKVHQAFSRKSEHTQLHCIAPEEIVLTLNLLDPSPKVTEGIVRGYKVKVLRQSISALDVTARRGAVAEVMAKNVMNIKNHNML